MEKHQSSRLYTRLLGAPLAAALLVLGAMPSSAGQPCAAAHIGLAPIELLAAYACAGTSDAAPLGLHDGQSFNLSGTIEGIDYGANLVHLRSRGEVVPISLTPTTAIVVHGQSGSIADLRGGSHITVIGHVRDGTLVAQTVNVSK